MTKRVYTLLHIPSGVLYSDVLTFEKKSLSIAFLNSIKTDKHGYFIYPDMVNIFTSSRKERAKAAKAIRDITNLKILLLKLELESPTNVFSSICSKYTKCEFEIVSIKTSQIIKVKATRLGWWDD